MDEHEARLQEASNALANMTDEDLQGIIDARDTIKLMKELHHWEAFAIAGIAVCLLELFIILYLGGAPMW